MKTFIAYRHTGESTQDLELLLMPIKEALEQQNIEVYCTFFDENSFKNKKIGERQILEHAFSEIDKINFLFLIQTTDSRSEGMLMEVGYCLAKKIPIVVAAKDNIGNSYLPEMADILIKWDKVEDLVVKIEAMNLDVIGKEKPPKTLKLYTDGGSRGNPGESAGAYVICNTDDTVVKKSGFYIGVATNNQAEYQALLKGLEKAKNLGISSLQVYLDSELVVKQLNGLYKIKNKALEPLYKQVKSISENFKTINFTHVPRALNKLADEEVNRILDEKKQ